MKILIIVHIFVQFFPPSLCDQIIIQTNYGPVLGTQHYVDNKKVYEFLGIPYAQPPIGNLRFQNPKEPIYRDYITDAKKPPPTCMQPLPEACKQINTIKKKCIFNYLIF